MDEAFVPLHVLLPELLPLAVTLEDEELGVRQIVTGCDVETPIELDLVVGGVGGAAGIEIGAAPPLYHLETSYPPVLHNVRVVVRSEVRDG